MARIRLDAASVAARIPRAVPGNGKCRASLGRKMEMTERVGSCAGAEFYDDRRLDGVRGNCKSTLRPRDDDDRRSTQKHIKQTPPLGLPRASSLGDLSWARRKRKERPSSDDEAAKVAEAAAVAVAESRRLQGFACRRE